MFGFDKVKSLVKAAVVRGRLRRKPAPPPHRPVVINEGPIEFYMNDRTTPTLVKQVTPPVAPAKPRISVRGYAGGGHARGTTEALAATCYVTLCNTLAYVASQADKPIEGWPSTSVLNVLPNAGKQLNAFYDRKSLQFFGLTHPAIGGTVTTAESTDIIAHELGHAVLDCYRPEMFNVPFVEVDSFHEAFADLTAMLHLLTYDEVIDHVLTETGGDLRKSNVVSRLAEEVGGAIAKLAGDRDPSCLRDAVNGFNYVSPSTLPKDAPQNQLAAECHSFGRIFLGAFYDVFVMVYEDQKAGLAPRDAVKAARDYLARYTLKAVVNVPVNANFYESVAKTLLWADVVLSDRKYHDRMHQIFIARGLLTFTLKMLSAPPAPEGATAVRFGVTKNLKLSDHMVRTLSDGNPLYDVELCLPQEMIYLYDNHGNLVDLVSVSDDETLSAAADAVHFLYENGKVSDDPSTPFEVKDGRLVRTHFAQSGFQRKLRAFPAKGCGKNGCCF